MKNKLGLILVTGSLSSGKTTYIKNELEKDERDSYIISFELGKEKYHSDKIKEFSPRYRRNNDWKNECKDFLESITTSVLYVEIGEADNLSILMKELFQINPNIEIDEIIYIQNVRQKNLLNSELGGNLFSFASEADTIVFTDFDEKNNQAYTIGENKTDSSKITNLGLNHIENDIEDMIKVFRKYNPFVSFEFYMPTSKFPARGFKFSAKGKLRENNSFFLGLIIASAAVFFYLFMYNRDIGIWNDFVLISLGMFIQAFPFLIAGLLLSSIIQVYISREIIFKFFGRNKGIKAYIMPIISGLVLPICDCASIPVFRSLLQKGVNLKSALIFLLAGPIINPIAISSTIYAYGFGRVLYLRLGLGLLISLIVAIYFRKYRPADIYRKDLNFNADSNTTKFNFDKLDNENQSKFGQMLEIGLYEFKNTFSYMLLGSILCGIIQVIIRYSKFDLFASFGYLSIIVMMALAFLLSLCSSSDSVFAKGFSQYLPEAASLSFLVYGPMIDYKNLMMMKAYFNGDFIKKLSIITTCISFFIFTLYHFFLYLI